jgi:hypothetical protein
MIDTPAAPPQAGPTPPVIHLPDLRQASKKVTSGSAKRQRHHVERFRTDDAEHEALHGQLRESGLSLGAYVMQLAALRGMGRRPRLRRRATLDVKAVTAALVAFNRGNNNLNQLAHGANRLLLIAEERGSRDLAAEAKELRRAADALRDQFAPSIAAILAALSHVREG